MTASIDWNKPITAAPAGGPLWGDAASQSPADRFAGIRDEQIKRAAVLIRATGGKPLTRATVRSAVVRLAKEVPGLRYKIGVAIFSGLAPISTLFGDDLPGKVSGRPEQWSPARRRELAAVVAAIQEANPGMSHSDALRALKAKMTAEREYPPSLKTLRNQLPKEPARNTNRRR